MVEDLLAWCRNGTVPCVLLDGTMLVLAQNEGEFHGVSGSLEDDTTIFYRCDVRMRRLLLSLRSVVSDMRLQ